MTFEKIAEILSEMLEMDASDITPETELLGVLDSLQMARTVIECEKKFRVAIFDEDVRAFHKAGDLAAYIEARLDDAGIGEESAEREKAGWYYR